MTEAGSLRTLARRPLVRLLLGALAVALVLWAIYRLRDVLTPFAVAFGLAYFLNPVANGLERVFGRWAARAPRLARVGPRTAAVTVLVLLVLAVAVAGVIVVVPRLSQQVAEAAAKVPGYVEKLRERALPLYEQLAARYPAQVEEARARMADTLRRSAPGLLAPFSRAIAQAFSSVLSFVLALLDLLVIPVFTTYLLFDMNHIRLGAAELVPHRFRPYAYSRLGEVDRLLSAFVRGQITVALILGTFYAVALSLCGVPMGLLVGFVIGLFNLVPFMSTILGLPLALVLSWLDDKSLPTLGVVALVFAFGQFVEGNFISPRIVGQSLGLHAVVIMLAVLVGGKTFGVVGMLLAVPTTAALSVFWSDLRAWYLASDFYAGGASPPAGGTSEP